MRDVIRIDRLLLIVLLFSPCSTIFSAEGEALRFIEDLQLGRNLPQMAESVAKSTTSYAVIVEALGANEAELTLRRELGRLTGDYQSEWNQNLALSYEEYFSEDELQSLREEKSESPHIKKLISHQSKVAEGMKRRSSTLLKDLATAALVGALRELPSEVQ